MDGHFFGLIDIAEGVSGDDDGQGPMGDEAGYVLADDGFTKDGTV